MIFKRKLETGTGLGYWEKKQKEFDDYLLEIDKTKQPTKKFLENWKLECKKILQKNQDDV